MKIKVISLKSTPNRRQAFISQNNFIDYEFFDGVEGHQLSEQMINDHNIFAKPTKLASLGAYGCALSHLKLWDYAINNNLAITVAEDDAIFRKDFKQESERIISNLPSDWDLILWGWNFDSILSIGDIKNISPVVMLFNQTQMRGKIEEFQNLHPKSTIFRLDKCFGIPAYSISPAGAKKFKSSCFPMKDFELHFPVLNRHIPNTGIDIAMNRIYADTNSFVAFPPLVITENQHEISTIQKKSKS